MLNKIRRHLYRAAAILGDANAAKRGPSAMVKRAGRKAVRRRVGRNLRRLGL